MKPFRIKMAHQLIVNYGLYRKMSVYVSTRNHLLMKLLWLIKKYLSIF